MSEYQYYEFRAIDRPLTQKQIAELGRYSSRAEVDATRWVNVYNFGDFRGDVKGFLAKYYDAFVYVANWGTHRFAFRVPKEVIDLDTARRYCPDDVAHVSGSGENLVFDLTSQEEGGEWEEGDGRMEALAPLREELLAGDRRVLYLAWLMRLGGYEEEVDESEIEPPVPPGLKKLSAAQEAFVEFMRIPEELVAAAGEESGPPEAGKQDEGNLAEWVAGLPAGEKDALLVALAEGTDPHVGHKLQRRFRQRLAARHDAPVARAAGRTVAQLREAAARIEEKQKLEAAQKLERARVRRETEEAAARAKRLGLLAGREDEAWKELEEWIGTKQSESYDRAVATLCDLRDLAKEAGKSGEFAARLGKLRARHASKSSLKRKLEAKGLMGR